MDTWTIVGTVFGIVGVAYGATSDILGWIHRYRNGSTSVIEAILRKCDIIKKPTWEEELLRLQNERLSRSVVIDMV